MDSIRNRAARLLCAAFGVDDADEIQTMLSPACDQTPKKLIDRLSAVLLGEGLRVAVDRSRIAQIVETQAEREMGEEELNSFVEQVFENEFGPARDCLEEAIRDLAERWNAEESGNDAICFDDDERDPYAGNIPKSS